MEFLSFDLQVFQTIRCEYRSYMIYMIVHTKQVEEKKRNKKQGLPIILSLFLNQLNKFNNKVLDVRFYLVLE